jgi:hypothetical protein
MGTVIYEASPFQAFLGSIGTTLLLVVLGVTAIGMSVFRSKDSRFTRVSTGLAGAFLLLISCGLAALTLFSLSNGARTVVLELNDKTIAADNCGDNGETCNRYVLSAATSTNTYDFDVPYDVYNKIQLNGCYQLTYYPNTGFYGLWLNTSSYQRIDNITRIAAADLAMCH